MPQTATQIANSALIKLGAPVISALGDVTTKEGRLINERFRPVLNMILRNHTWHFAKAFADVTGVPDTNVKPFEWRFHIPTDAARILSVGDMAGSYYTMEYEQAYKIFGRELYATGTGTPPLLRITFVSNAVNDTQVYPDDFAEVVACYLAADLAVSITQTDERRQQLLGQYEGLLRIARFNGAVELAPGYAIQDEGSWVATREGYGINDRMNRDIDLP